MAEVGGIAACRPERSSVRSYAMMTAALAGQKIVEQRTPYGIQDTYVLIGYFYVISRTADSVERQFDAKKMQRP